MASFDRYLPGPPQSLPGVQNLQRSLAQVADNRVRREQMATQESMNRQRLEAQEAARRAAAQAAIDKERREGKRGIEREIRTAQMGISPLGLDNLTAAAAQYGINIRKPDTPDPVDPNAATDAQLFEQAGLEDAAEAGMRTIDYGDGRNSVYDPRDLMAEHERRGQDMGEAAAGLPKNPSANPKYDAVFRKELARMTLYYRGHGLPDETVLKMATADAKAAAARESGLDQARARGSQFVVGEGRRRREEERGELAEFQKTYEVNKTKSQVRGLDMAAKSISQNNGVLTGAAQTMMAGMFQSGVLSNQDFARTVVGKAGIGARVESWIRGQLEGDLSEKEKAVLAQGILELSKIKRTQLNMAQTEFDELMKTAKPDVREVYERRRGFWFGNNGEADTRGF